jgi:hypothetical protein
LKNISESSRNKKTLKLLICCSSNTARGVGFISVEYFIPILKMSATVEFTVNPVDNQSVVFLQSSSVKSSTDLAMAKLS